MRKISIYYNQISGTGEVVTGEFSLQGALVSMERAREELCIKMHDRHKHNKAGIAIYTTARVVDGRSHLYKKPVCIYKNRYYDTEIRRQKENGK